MDWVLALPYTVISNLLDATLLVAHTPAPTPSWRCQTCWVAHHQHPSVQALCQGGYYREAGAHGGAGESPLHNQGSNANCRTSEYGMTFLRLSLSGSGVSGDVAYCCLADSRKHMPSSQQGVDSGSIPVCVFLSPLTFSVPSPTLAPGNSLY